MKAVEVVFVVVVSTLGAFFSQQIWANYNKPSLAHRVLREMTDNEELVKHSDTFSKKEIVKVTNNCYVAIGYALANSIFLIAPEGVIVVDVMESTISAREALKDFRKISDKPIKALIFTHNHADHIGGATAYIEDESNPPDVWAHQLLPNEVNKFHTTAFGAKFRRSMRQFGVFVKRRLNAGIGPVVQYGTKDDSFGFVEPNRLVNQPETNATIAGLDVTILHIPGETNDQIGVWVPSWKMMMCADDIYKAYPNIYTIRGAPARDPVDWYTSVDRMLELQPEHLVPSHSRPVSGKENIKAILEPYRDSIQYIHDQALRYINKGYVPDDVAKHVKLPEKLAMHPYNREFYGTVPWSVKGVFQLYLGWFSGDPVELFPLSSTDRASRIVSLAGGTGNLISEAVQAWNENDIQWALELVSYVLHVDRNNAEAKKIKVDCLLLLGATTINAIARNYYLTSAREELGEVKLGILERGRKDLIASLPMDQLFVIMSTMYMPEKCGSKEMSVMFVFKDTGRLISVQLRNGVAIVKSGSTQKKIDVKVVTTEGIWRDIMAEEFKNLSTFSKDRLKIEGGIENLKSFVECFERDFNG